MADSAAMLKSMKVAILLTEGFEQSEFASPKQVL